MSSLKSILFIYVKKITEHQNERNESCVCEEN